MRVPRVFSAAAAVFMFFSAEPVCGQVITCWFGSVQNLAFGNYAPLSAAPTDSTSQMQIRCVSAPFGGVITVDLSPGQCTYLNRCMRSGANSLYYNLYMDAARTTVWGDGTGGTDHHVIIVNRGLFRRTLDVYGRIPPLQDVPAGNYSDTITVTVNW